MAHPLDQLHDWLATDDDELIQEALGQVADGDLGEVVPVLVYLGKTEALIGLLPRLRTDADALQGALAAVVHGQMPTAPLRAKVAALALAIAAHEGQASLIAPLAMQLPLADRATALMDASWRSHQSGPHLAAAQAVADQLNKTVWEGVDRMVVATGLAERMKEAMRVGHDGLMAIWWAALSPYRDQLNDQAAIQLASTASAHHRTAYYDRLFSDTALANLARSADKSGDLLDEVAPHLAEARLRQVLAWLQDAALDPDEVIPQTMARRRSMERQDQLAQQPSQGGRPRLRA